MHFTVVRILICPVHLRVKKIRHMSSLPKSQEGRRKPNLHSSQDVRHRWPFWMMRTYPTMLNVLKTVCTIITSQRKTYFICVNRPLQLAIYSHTFCLKQHKISMPSSEFAYCVTIGSTVTEQVYSSQLVQGFWQNITSPSALQVPQSTVHICHLKNSDFSQSLKSLVKCYE